MRSITFGLFTLVLFALCGCAPDYSPNTYASTAVQQANKVEPGVVVGFRQVAISASGTVGAVAGGAAGGVLGSQVGASNVSQALGAVGGGIVGSFVGTTLEHATGDTTGWEYIIRKPNGDLLSLTQREEKPIALGQKVLVITGGQARIIPDYSVAVDPTPSVAKEKPEAKTKHHETKDVPAVKEQLEAPPPESSPAASPATPLPVANAPAVTSPPAAVVTTPIPPAAAVQPQTIAVPSTLLPANAVTTPIPLSAATPSADAKSPDQPSPTVAPAAGPPSPIQTTPATPPASGAPAATTSTDTVKSNPGPAIEESSHSAPASPPPSADTP